mmetsp:Transcript_28951/g.44497  ORF Transcript_28951/g.44497 Transcript_28951/m.44497 type:complete len:106 (+) Transcript_28951:120-437(+)
MSVPETGLYLRSLAAVTSLACYETFKAYVTSTTSKESLETRVALATDVQKCSNNVSKELTAKCQDDFTGYMDCLKKNKDNVVKCVALKDTLQECAAMNKIGELGN